MDERIKKAFEFAQDTTKQLITLATGVVALGVTFFGNFATTSASPDARSWMTLAWFLFLASILAGVWTLMSLTGSLGRRGSTNTPLSIYGANVRIPSAIQIVFFVLGIIVTVLAGRMALTTQPSPAALHALVQRSDGQILCGVLDRAAAVRLVVAGQETVLSKDDKITVVEKCPP